VATTLPADISDKAASDFRCGSFVPTNDSPLEGDNKSTINRKHTNPEAIF
jgi:hypothetical protein